MQRKLTITIANDVYRGLHERVGRGHISSFIEELVRPHVVGPDELASGYAAMAADAAREGEAAEWIGASDPRPGATWSASSRM